MSGFRRSTFMCHYCFAVGKTQQESPVFDVPRSPGGLIRIYVTRGQSAQRHCVCQWLLESDRHGKRLQAVYFVFVLITIQLNTLYTFFFKIMFKHTHAHKHACAYAPHAPTHAGTRTHTEKDNY